MQSPRESKNSHKNRNRRNINAPFDIQRTGGSRKAVEELLTLEQIERLRNIDDTRELGLRYLHDPQAFALLWSSTTIHPELRRGMRKLVQIQTINAVNNGFDNRNSFENSFSFLDFSFYQLADGQKVLLDKNRMKNAAKNTLRYENDFAYDVTREETSNETSVKIYVINGDCLETAMAFKNADPRCRPVVLNMASRNHPGGGWRNGSLRTTFFLLIFIGFFSGCGAQEENLHRRTNLFQCLEDSYGELETTREWSYPIPEVSSTFIFVFSSREQKKTENIFQFGGIYSSDVSVFRGAEVHGYPFFLSGPQYISFIACAAYSHPPTESNDRDEQRLSGNHFIQNTKRKIETIFQIAEENRHDVLILSAFGW